MYAQLILLIKSFVFYFQFLNTLKEGEFSVCE